jgi:hypothetical protein
MKNLISSVYKSLKDENWYAALFVSLTLPDICCGLEYGKSSAAKYSAWFEGNVSQYNGFLSGDDCSSLRCSFLHEGKEDITDQSKRKILDHFKFLTSGAHRFLFKDTSFGDGERESFLVLDVQTFCKDICNAVEKWLEDKSQDQTIQARVKNILEIHGPGFTYKGAVKF